MNNLMQRPEIKYGLIIGFGVSLYVLLEYLLGFHTKYVNIGRYSGFVSTLIPIFGLYYAIKTKKFQSPEKTITFKNAVIAGVLTSILASIIISGFFFLYNTRINPGWINKALQEEKKAMVKEGLKEKEVNDNINKLKQLYNPQAQLLSVFTGTTINGTILSLIIAAIVSRKKKETTSITTTETTEQR